jgi:hypothetical protein
MKMKVNPLYKDKGMKKEDVEERKIYMGLSREDCCC